MKYFVDNNGKVCANGKWPTDPAAALEASIKKWKFIVTQLQAGVSITAAGVTSCALCQLFHDFPNECTGCPVLNKTGYRGCARTPYDYFEAAIRGSQDAELQIIYAQKEVEFLEALRQA